MQVETGYKQSIVATGVSAGVLKFTDSLIVNAARWSDDTLDCDGILFPNTLRSEEQTDLNAMITDLQASYSADDNGYAGSGSKKKIITKFGGALTNLYSMKVTAADVQTVSTPTSGNAKAVIVSESGSTKYGVLIRSYRSGGTFNIYAEGFKVVDGILTMSSETALQWDSGYNEAFDCMKWSDNEVIVAYADYSTYYATCANITLDTTDLSCTNGTINTLNSAATHSWPYKLSLNDTDEAILIYATSSTQIFQHLARSGTSVNNGSAVNFSEATSYGDICPLGTDKHFYVGRLGSDNSCRMAVVSVSGTVPSFGTVKDVDTGNTKCDAPKCAKLDTDKAIVMTNDADNSDTLMVGVCTISGTVPADVTLEELVGDNNTGVTGSYEMEIIQTNTDEVIYVYHGDDSDHHGGKITVSGSAITIASNEEWADGSVWGTNVIRLGQGIFGDGDFCMGAYDRWAYTPGASWDIAVNGVTVIDDQNIYFEKTLLLNTAMDNAEEAFIEITNNETAGAYLQVDELHAHVV